MTEVSQLVIPDASVIVSMLIDSGDVGERVFRRLATTTLLAPHLLATEVDSALRGLERGRKLTANEASAARDSFAELPIDLWPWSAVADSAWDLRANASTYDAGYLALAELTGATLVTGDRRLAAVPGCSARVEVI